jgi:hypothetical protein
VQSMAGRVYVTDQDAEEPEDFIVGLTTQVNVLSCLCPRLAQELYSQTELNSEQRHTRMTWREYI